MSPYFLDGKHWKYRTPSTDPEFPNLVAYSNVPPEEWGYGTEVCMVNEPKENCTVEDD